jgi:hypothetical protein
MSLEISEIWTRDHTLLPALAGINTGVVANSAAFTIQTQVNA